MFVRPFVSPEEPGAAPRASEGLGGSQKELGEAEKTSERKSEKLMDVL